MGALTSLPGLNATGQSACTRCSGIPARFRCGCGREVTAGDRGRCWWCVLAELVTGLLAGSGGQVPTHLRPLADGLVSMRRPQSGVIWLRRRAITRETLQGLAHGRILCSHAALDAAGADRAVEYLRCLLLSWARQQRIIRDVNVPVISTEGAEACLPASDARLAAIRRLLLDETFALGDRIVGCLVVLYGQQSSKIAALRTADTSCVDGTTQLRLGADWLDVPEPVATLLRDHLRDRSSAATAADPASPWLFPGQFAGEHRSYRRLLRALHQLGIPARASRLAAWRELVRHVPPAVLADALGVSPGTVMHHAFLGGADWSAYAARRSVSTSNGGTRQEAVADD